MLLDGVRAQGALFDRSFVRAPWSLRFEDHAPLTLVTMLGPDIAGGGTGAWVRPDGHDPVRVEPGDVAVLVGPEPFTISDEPDAPPRVVIHDDDVCTSPGGARVDDVPHLCSHRPLDDGDNIGNDDAAALLKGSYRVQGSVGDRMLRGLPRVLTVPAATDGSRPAAGVDLIVAELAHPRLGQQAVLDRLLDLLLVSMLREWLDRPESSAPAWYQALSDPVVGPALRLVHHDPAHPWTVATLADRVAVSRATFARRFTDLVGEPPIGYLACWRLCLAADLLHRTDVTVGAVARQVGYANPEAFSVAFTRVYGVRPSEYRRDASATPARAPA